MNASLKEATPDHVLETIKDLCWLADRETLSRFSKWSRNPVRWYICHSFPWTIDRENKSSKLLYCPINKYHTIRINSALKNYDNEIENFLERIRPRLFWWEWNRNIVAQTIWEDDEEYVNYYLWDTWDNEDEQNKREDRFNFSPT